MFNVIKIIYTQKVGRNASLSYVFYGNLCQHRELISTPNMLRCEFPGLGARKVDFLVYIFSLTTLKILCLPHIWHLAKS